MTIYKITNITNFAGKREVKFNSPLDIEYVDAMMKKTIVVKPGETIFLQISSLPLSVHRLRVKRLISVVEVGATELQKTIDAAKPAVPKKESVEEAEKKVAIAAKKKSGKKYHEEETADSE